MVGRSVWEVFRVRSTLFKVADSHLSLQRTKISSAGRDEFAKFYHLSVTARIISHERCATPALCRVSFRAR